MKKMKIFESAECTVEQTPGAKKDLELMRVHIILSTLRSNGIDVERYNIVYDKSPFIENKKVYMILEDDGIESLPIIVIDDEVVMVGRYPSRGEFAKLLGISKNILINKQNNGILRYLDMWVKKVLKDL